MFANVVIVEWLTNMAKNDVRDQNNVFCRYEILCKLLLIIIMIIIIINITIIIILFNFKNMYIIYRIFEVRIKHYIILSIT